MTTQQIFTRFQRLYQEKSTRYFSNEWAIELINDAVDHLDSEIAGLHPEFMGLLSSTLSFTANQQEETLPAGLVEIKVIEITDRGGPPYPRLRPATFDDRSNAPILPSADFLVGGGYGEPSHYYVRGQAVASDPSKIGWIPIPTRTAANNVTAWYHGTRALATAIDGSIPDLPVDWHPLIAYWMAVLAAGSEEKSNAGFYAGLYNSRLKNRLADAIRGREENTPELVEVVDYD